MHLKRFIGRVVSFLLKSALYALGVAVVLALTLGMFVCMQWVGEEDATDDRDIASVLFAIPVFVGSVTAYVFRFVPLVRRATFFTSYSSLRAAKKVHAPAMTPEKRRRAILRIFGGFVVPVVALSMGVLWEFGSRDTGWSGMGAYAALAVSCVLCGLYFGVYLRAVNSGRIAIRQRGPVFNDSFSVMAEPGSVHTSLPPSNDVFVIDPRKGHGLRTEVTRKPPSRANHPLSDGTIEYAFDSEDCNEWYK